MKAKVQPLRVITGMETPDTRPPDRGRLCYDFQIPELFFGGLPHIVDKVRWVRERLPRATRVKIGNASAWYELDILEYIKSQQGRTA